MDYKVIKVFKKRNKIFKCKKTTLKNRIFIYIITNKINENSYVELSAINFYSINMSDFNFTKTNNAINSVQGNIPIKAKEFIASKLDGGIFLRHINSYGNYAKNYQLDDESKR